MTTRFTTLGPTGSCHENAVAHYLEFQGIAAEAEIDLTTDFDEGLERVRHGDTDFLVQCSAHPEVHLITERYFGEVHVVDTFVYPTKELVLLTRVDVEHPRTLGLVPATAGYVDVTAWEVVTEPSKPIVGRNLLAGKYDAGLTQLEYLELSGGALRLAAYIGAVTTTWLVYGTRPRFTGEVIGTPCREYLVGGAR